MKATLVFSRTKVVIWLVVVLALITAITGCYPVRSKDDATGIFKLVESDGTIRLELDASGRFFETTTIPTDGVSKVEGTWTWVDGRIGFDGLWIPKVFAPE